MNFHEMVKAAEERIFMQKVDELYEQLAQLLNGEVSGCSIAAMSRLIGTIVAQLRKAPIDETLIFRTIFGAIFMQYRGFNQGPDRMVRSGREEALDEFLKAIINAREPFNEEIDQL
jgi:hypothetical protein